MNELVEKNGIAEKIYLIRGVQVMLDRDLAELYQVETKVLNRAVKRNEKRFPPTFMFQLSGQEFADWRSQIETSSANADLRFQNGTSSVVGSRRQTTNFH